MTRWRSIPITRPKPWHSSQAPSGELKEKSAGVGRLQTLAANVTSQAGTEGLDSRLPFGGQLR